MVFLSMLALCTHVAMRYIFNHPLNWVVDISTIFIFLITFLGAPWLLREEGHVSLDVLKGYLSHKNWMRLQFINSLVCAVVCAVITVFGIIETISLQKMDIYLDMPLAPPKWPIIAVVPIGALLLTIQFGRRAHKFLKKSGKHSRHYVFEVKDSSPIHKERHK